MLTKAIWDRNVEHPGLVGQKIKIKREKNKREQKKLWQFVSAVLQLMAGTTFFDNTGISWTRIFRRYIYHCRTIGNRRRQGAHAPFSLMGTLTATRHNYPFRNLFFYGSPNTTICLFNWRDKYLYIFYECDLFFIILF